MNIPNLPVGIMVESNGNPSAEELLFRQNLIQTLQNGVGQEGYVVPSQKATDIATIVANTNTQGQYTCAPGTLLYDTTNNLLKAVILVGGVPTLKTVTLT